MGFESFLQYLGQWSPKRGNSEYDDDAEESGQLWELQINKLELNQRYSSDKTLKFTLHRILIIRALQIMEFEEFYYEVWVSHRASGKVGKCGSHGYVAGLLVLYIDG